LLGRFSVRRLTEQPGWGPQQRTTKRKDAKAPGRKGDESLFTTQGQVSIFTLQISRRKQSESRVLQFVVPSLRLCDFASLR